MIDHATNSDGDTGRLKMLADWESDDPEQAPEFKRDQHLTPQALFKAKVLAVLLSQLSQAQDDPRAFIVINRIMNRIEAIDL